MLAFIGNVFFHGEFKDEIVVVIHWGPKISAPAIKGLKEKNELTNFLVVLWPLLSPTSLKDSE